MPPKKKPQRIIKTAIRTTLAAGEKATLPALRASQGPRFDRAVSSLAGPRGGGIGRRDIQRFRKIKRGVKKRHPEFRGRGRGGGAGEKEEFRPGAFAESDVATTSLLRAQGKAFALGRESAAGTLRGQTSKPRREEEEEEPGGGGKKKRKRKGMLKKRKGVGFAGPGVRKPGGRSRKVR